MINIVTGMTACHPMRHCTHVVYENLTKKVIKTSASALDYCAGLEITVMDTWEQLLFSAHLPKGFHWAVTGQCKEAFPWG